MLGTEHSSGRARALLPGQIWSHGVAPVNTQYVVDAGAANTALWASAAALTFNVKLLPFHCYCSVSAHHVIRSDRRNLTQSAVLVFCFTSENTCLLWCMRSSIVFNLCPLYPEFPEVYFVIDNH